jgi:hypothetical protein
MKSTQEPIGLSKYVGPHLLLANMTGGPLPPLESVGEARLSETADRSELYLAEVKSTIKLFPGCLIYMDNFTEKYKYVLFRVQGGGK